ncbi:hypothetical protein T07_1896 [Trichinella nelsoni]|uniref:Uncharacterized protein n=1 Tax=Trichinella nelsoni TaxID=6336 RepID=A0A0V0SMC4_9BILA|nr:hypothetical protein T07_1896 [Trichinella nelsoni]
MGTELYDIMWERIKRRQKVADHADYLEYYVTRTWVESKIEVDLHYSSQGWLCLGVSIRGEQLSGEPSNDVQCDLKIYLRPRLRQFQNHGMRCIKRNILLLKIYSIQRRSPRPLYQMFITLLQKL